MDRLSWFLLMHRGEYSLDHVRSLFTTEEVDPALFRKVIESDRRFSVNESEEGVFVSRANVSMEESKVLQAVERWKSTMSEYFRQYNHDVKLCMLPQIIKRPVDVPKHIRLQDILSSDNQRRFLLLTPNLAKGNESNPEKKVDETIVKYKCTPQEVEEYHEEWRRNVVTFLLKQPHPVPLVTIGTHVIKPKNLGKNQKLIDVVKLDPQKRFNIFIDQNHNSLTRLSVADSYAIEHWRQLLHSVWLKSHSKRLMDIDVLQAPRPLCLSKSITLRSIILTDPKNRFCGAPDFALLQRVESPRLTQSRPSTRAPYHFPQNSNAHYRNKARDMQLHANAKSNVYYPPYYVPQSNSFPQRSFHTNTVSNAYHQGPPPGLAKPQAPQYPKTFPLSGNFLNQNKTFNGYGHCESKENDVENEFQFGELSELHDMCSEINNFAPSQSIESTKRDISGAGDCSFSSLERTVSSEFQEYTKIPGLLRFLSDTI